MTFRRPRIDMNRSPIWLLSLAALAALPVEGAVLTQTKVIANTGTIQAVPALRMGGLGAA